MCYNKTIIKNKTKLYRPAKDRYYLEVPCGNCLACIDSYRDEWFVRTCREMEYTESIGGMNLFILLTYRPDALPYFVDGSYKIPCFVHDHIKNFMKQFRVELNRKFGISKDAFKYLVACEYGEDKNRTRRPHYHCAFHFSRKLPLHQVMTIIRKIWSKNQEKHGFVFPEPKNEDKALVANCYNSAKYISKYVSKDYLYFSNPLLVSYLGTSIGKRSSCTDVSRYDKIKPYLPKHWQSNGYGIALLDDIVKSSSPSDELVVGKRFLNDDYSHPYPMYIRNKLFYETRNGIRYLTDFGKKLKLESFTKQLNLTIASLKSKFSYPYLCKCFESDEESTKLVGYDRCQLYEYLVTLLGYRSVDNLAMYQLVYKGYTMTPSEINDTIYKDWSLDTFMNYGPVIYRSRIEFDTTDIAPLDNSVRYYEPSRDLDSRLFNSLEVFQDFDRLLGLIYKCDKNYYRRKFEAKKLKEKDSNKLRYLKYSY